MRGTFGKRSCSAVAPLLNVAPPPALSPQINGCVYNRGGGGGGGGGGGPSLHAGNRLRDKEGHAWGCEGEVVSHAAAAADATPLFHQEQDKKVTMRGIFQQNPLKVSTENVIIISKQK